MGDNRISLDPTTAAIAAQITERERLRAEVVRLTSEIDRLRSLVEEACGELDDTGSQFAAGRAVEIRRSAGIKDV